MFNNCKTTIAVTDLKRAREFYGKKLGLRELGTEMPEGDLVFACGDHQLYLYERNKPSGSTATLCSFETDNLETTVEELRGKGIRFEEYDTPEIQTKNGIATLGPIKVAWFKDPDGNILAVGNPVQIRPRGTEVEARAR